MWRCASRSRGPPLNNLPDAAGEPVTKRLVFYCPGYDPEAETRYRRLFVTGFAQTARRFGIMREIGPVETDPDIPAQRWSVVAGKGAWRTETLYEMLCWHDIVH